MAIAVVIGALFGAAGMALVARSARAQIAERLANAVRERNVGTEQLADAHAELEIARTDNARLEAHLEAERAHAGQRLKELTQARETLAHQFKSLSQDILEEKSRAFSQQSKSHLETLIQPLREHIGRFEKQVKDAYDAENRQRSALAEQVRLLEVANKAIAEDATNLANALRGEAKTQGNWGEMILETVLERSGLQKGSQYDVQVASRAEDGRLQRPDAIVYLPEGRGIVIDSKVSLTAYVRLHETKDENGRRKALAEHLLSVRQHLKELSAKHYQDNENFRTLDYVFMFIPSEAAYVEALRGDFKLQSEALERNIALVSPTTLMPMLRAVANLWRLEKQEANAADIAKRAGALYDKFVGFLADLDKVAKNLERVNSAFAEARNKLVAGRGNLVRQAEQLQAMGANTSKTMTKHWQHEAALGADRAAATGHREDNWIEDALDLTGTDDSENP